MFFQLIFGILRGISNSIAIERNVFEFFSAHFPIILFPFIHANVRLIFVAHEKLVFNIFYISPISCRTNIYSYNK